MKHLAAIGERDASTAGTLTACELRLFEAAMALNAKEPIPFEQLLKLARAIHVAVDDVIAVVSQLSHFFPVVGPGIVSARYTG